MNEGAYEDGVADGKRGYRNPRASSIYGPGSGDYSRGLADGQKQAEKDREERRKQRKAEEAPYEKMSAEELLDQYKEKLMYNFKVYDLGQSGKEIDPEMNSQFHKNRKEMEIMGGVLQTSKDMSGGKLQTFISQARKEFENKNKQDAKGSDNNYAIFINGKQWKVVKNINHARAIEKTLKSKGKKVEVKNTDQPVSESTSAGAVAAVATPVGGMISRQKKNADGTVKNALDMDTNVMGQKKKRKRKNA